MNKIQLKYLIKECVLEILDESKSSDPTKEQMIELLSSKYSKKEGFVDSAKRAIYWYAHNNYDEQSNNLHNILSTQKLDPKPFKHEKREGVETESRLTRILYNELCETFGGKETSIGFDPDKHQMIWYLEKTKLSQERGFQDSADLAIYWYAKNKNTGDDNLYDVYVEYGPFSQGSLSDDDLAMKLYNELEEEFGY